MQCFISILSSVFFLPSLLMYSPEPRVPSYLAHSLDSTHSAMFPEVSLKPECRAAKWGSLFSHVGADSTPPSAPRCLLRFCLRQLAVWMSKFSDISERLYESRENRLKLLSHFTRLWFIFSDLSPLTAEDETRQHFSVVTVLFLQQLTINNLVTLYQLNPYWCLHIVTQMSKASLTLFGESVDAIPLVLTFICQDLWCPGKKLHIIISCYLTQVFKSGLITQITHVAATSTTYTYWQLLPSFPLSVCVNVCVPEPLLAWSFKILTMSHHISSGCAWRRLMDSITALQI